jgi:ankyrin repeat protein
MQFNKLIDNIKCYFNPKLKITNDLIISIAINDYNLAKDAINKGANINYNRKDFKLIIYAMNVAYYAYNKDFNICYLLLSNEDLNINVRDEDNYSLLHGAIFLNDIRLVRYLIKLNPFDKDNIKNISPIELALQNKFYDAVIQMAIHIEPKELKRFFLNLVLLKYINENNITGINNVISKGANVNIPFFNGKSIFELIKESNPEILKFIT